MVIALKKKIGEESCLHHYKIEEYLHRPKELFGYINTLQNRTIRANCCYRDFS